MNILFSANYLGLHGSSIDILMYAKAFEQQGHRIFFIGEDGFLRNRFEELATDIYLLNNRKYYPTLKKVALLVRLMKYWNIDVVIGVGKFLILECQLASLILRSHPPINMMDFSPRKYHWSAHPKWHLPQVGYLIVNCPFYRDFTVSLYRWPIDTIYLFAARYELPDRINIKRAAKIDKTKVVFVRRLDDPKYKSILKSLDQIDEWGSWTEFSIQIVGGGTHETLVLEEVDKIRSQHPEADITCLGKREDAIELMQEADIVVGSERVAVEGMSQGRLVLLSTDYGFIDLITPEVIKKYSYDNFFGFNYTPLSSHELKEKLFSVLSDPEKYIEIIQGNFKYLKAHLDIKHGKKIFGDLVSLAYQKTLSNREVASGLLRILKSWIFTLLYLFKDKILKFKLKLKV